MFDAVDKIMYDTTKDTPSGRGYGGAYE